MRHALGRFGLLSLAGFVILLANPVGGRAQTPPIITQDLTNQNVLPGQPAILRVGVSGTGPFTYQWQQNGTNIPQGIITTVAGGNGQTYGPILGDGGMATNASLNLPYDVTVDSHGNLFITDTDDHRIRKVGVDGIITTVAGNGTNGFSGDGGSATNAELTMPQGVALDSSGNLFIADTQNNRIRKVDDNGIITTVAGDAGSGFNGDGHPATNTTLAQPGGVAVDGDGALIIADTYNGRIREATFGIIFTVAGGGGNNPGDGGEALSATLEQPQGVAVDQNGNMFIADTGNQRIQEVDDNGIITTLAGGGTNYPGDGGAATNAMLNHPAGVAVDPSGNVFFSDSAHGRIREINTAGIITTVAGGGNNYFGDGGAATNAELANPQGMAVDGYGNLFFADSAHGRVRQVNIHGPTFLATNVFPIATNYDVVITSPYGSVTSSFATVTEVFGPGIAAEPQSQLAGPGSNVTFSVTATGMGPFTYQWTFDGEQLLSQTNATFTITNVNTNKAGNYQVMVGNPYGSVISSIASLAVMLPTLQLTEQPVVAGGTDTLSVTVYGGGPLRYQWLSNGVNLPNYTATVVAGGGQSNPGDGGPATNAVLAAPVAVALDASGNLYIADTEHNRIREVNSNGIITTLAGAGRVNIGDGGPATNAILSSPSAVTVDANGNVFIADTIHSRIRKVGLNGIITTVAGNGVYGFSGDGGLATNAELGYPYGVAVDTQGNLYIADGVDQCVRKVGTDGVISTVAGKGGFDNYGSSGDGGAAINARLNYPHGVALDAYGNLFIADSDNGRIREVGANSIITTVAGGGNGGAGSLATNASLLTPYSVAVDAYGDLFIAGYGGGSIQQAEIGGIINPVASKVGGEGVAVDASGNLYIAATSQNCIYKIVFQGPNLLLTNLAAGFDGSYDVVVMNSHGSASTPTFAVFSVLSPQNLTASWSNGTGAQIQLIGSPTAPYVLQSTTNLTPPIYWQPIATNYPDANSNWIFTDTNALTNTATFYRAVLP